MTEQIAAVLADVDGTLVRHNQLDVSPEVEAAVNAMAVPLLPVTGRMYSLMGPLASTLNLRSLATLDGGATVAKAETGERLWTDWLNGAATENIVQAVGSMCTLLSCKADYEPFDPANIDLPVFAAAEDSPSVFGVHYILHEEAIDQSLAVIPGIKYRFMSYRSDPSRRCFQVTKAGVDKRSGGRRMLELADLSDARPLVIEDDFRSGEPLFRLADECKIPGIKVAMGDAQEELKDIADFVAPSAEDNGVVVALQRYGLIKR